MPKKKGSKNHNNADVTIHDYANSSKPGTRVRKLDTKLETSELTWEDCLDDDYDIVEEITADGSKNFVYKKKKPQPKPDTSLEDCPGQVYPEIIWYFISRYIRPEQVCCFALICKDAYAVTRTESFWRTLYNIYCKDHRGLPDKLKLENNNKTYGLRQRVIRGLFHTYSTFSRRLKLQPASEYTPHMLVKRRCVSVWYTAERDSEDLWTINFKLKKYSPLEKEKRVNFIEEMGRLDANPDEETKLLQVACKRYQHVPPVMGMILSSVTFSLCQGFRYNKLVLGFNTSQHVSRDIKPEVSVVLAPVTTTMVLDWWHPMYPHHDSLPSCDREEEATVLKGDFFESDDLNL